MVETGVYRILNIVTGHCYVGSTADSFATRWGVHRRQLNGGRHKNHHLQKDWKRYGEARFSFSIVERLDEEPRIRAREAYHIDRAWLTGRCYNARRRHGWL